MGWSRGMCLLSEPCWFYPSYKMYVVIELYTKPTLAYIVL